MRAKRIDEAIQVPVLFPQLYVSFSTFVMWQIFELTKDASGEPEFGLYTAIMKAYGIKGDANMILRSSSPRSLLVNIVWLSETLSS